MSNPLLEKLKKASTVKESSILEDSKFFNEKDLITTDVPMLNVAHSGSFDGGFAPGLTLWAGPSKNFKTSLALVDGKAFCDKYDDGVILFYDSEFGTPQSYFEAFGIPTDRVFHTPITDIEQLKFDIMQQINGLTRNDRIMIIVDSIGNLASKKEVDDALEGKSVADMTRAKQLKSLFRMVTPHLTMKDIPMVVVNHTYKCGTAEMEVLMADGTKKFLPDVMIGDVVMTREGPEAVAWTTKHEDAYITDIEMEDGSTLSFTGGHRFLVNGEWKFVEDLQPGDEIDCHAV